MNSQESSLLLAYIYRGSRSAARRRTSFMQLLDLRRRCLESVLFLGAVGLYVSPKKPLRK